MSSSKKIDLYRNFAAGVYNLYVWGPEPHTLSPLHTIYVYTVYLFHREMEGELKQREGERGNSSQSWVDQHDWLYL